MREAHGSYRLLYVLRILLVPVKIQTIAEIQGGGNVTGCLQVLRSAFLWVQHGIRVLEPACLLPISRHHHPQWHTQSSCLHLMSAHAYHRAPAQDCRSPLLLQALDDCTGDAKSNRTAGILRRASSFASAFLYSTYRIHHILTLNIFNLFCCAPLDLHWAHSTWA